MTAEQAWDQMRYLSKLLRARQPIPNDLADFVADAIEAIEGKDLEDKAKGKAFTDELCLTALNRRKVDISIRDLQVERDFGDDLSQNKFTARMAAIEGVTPGTILNRMREADNERRKELLELSQFGEHND